MWDAQDFHSVGDICSYSKHSNHEVVKRISSPFAFSDQPGLFTEMPLPSLCVLKLGFNISLKKLHRSSGYKNTLMPKFVVVAHLTNIYCHCPNLD